MTKSNWKCPVCNGCTQWVYYSSPNRYTHCNFCKKFFQLLPGKRLEEVEDKEFIIGVPKHVKWYWRKKK